MGNFAKFGKQFIEKAKQFWHKKDHDKTPDHTPHGKPSPAEKQPNLSQEKPLGENQKAAHQQADTVREELGQKAAEIKGKSVEGVEGNATYGNGGNQNSGSYTPSKAREPWQNNEAPAKGKGREL